MQMDSRASILSLNATSYGNLALMGITLPRSIFLIVIKLPLSLTQIDTCSSSGFVEEVGNMISFNSRVPVVWFGGAWKKEFKSLLA